MMINCPKCNLLQPKDQYCAQCGVNMETWKPPQKPLLKKLLSNWMVQLGLLFLIILSIVMWDSLSGRKADLGNNPPPPTALKIERDDQGFIRESDSPPPEELQETAQQEVKVKANQAAPTQPHQAQPSLGLRKRISLKMITITPTALENLVQVGTRVDEGIYIVNRKAGFLTNNRKNIRGFGSAIRKDYKLGQPVNLFYGEVDQETGLTLGFYAQVTIAEGSTPESISIEGRVWHQLKLSDEPSSALFFEANLQNQDGVYVVDPSVHDIQFTPEEVALFESSRKLSMLNDEMFVENLSDIALFIEIK